MSGPFFAILDPQHNFSPAGGVKINLSENTSTYQGHLTTFDSLLPNDWEGKEFTGSVIRLPLRNRESDISNKVVESHEISQLLHDFIKDEMNIALLFLENVKTIELYEINERGREHRLPFLRSHALHSQLLLKDTRPTLHPSPLSHRKATIPRPGAFCGVRSPRKMLHHFWHRGRGSIPVLR
jgi:hypothetical protein